ncbi:unnamed protein product [Lota lota]
MISRLRRRHRHGCDCSDPVAGFIIGELEDRASPGDSIAVEKEEDEEDEDEDEGPTGKDQQKHSKVQRVKATGWRTTGQTPDQRKQLTIRCGRAECCVRAYEVTVGG